MAELRLQLWTPCDKELPDDLNYYLVTVENVFSPRRISIAYYDPFYGSWTDAPTNEYYEYLDEKVVAWMPLPECYEE